MTSIKSNTLDSEGSSICPYCGCGCKIKLEEKEGKLKARGAGKNSLNNRYLCIKGSTSGDWIQSDDRLTKPLIKNREGGFDEVEWYQALGHVAIEFQRIKETYGPRAIGVFVSAKTTNEEIYIAQKFARVVLGTHNVDHCARLCHATTAVGLAQNLGAGVMTNSINDIASNSDVLLITGTNSASSHPLCWSIIKKHKKKTGRPFIIVVDPRKSDTAKFADLHIPIIPGTDQAFVNGLLKVIYDENLEDEEFIQKNTKMLSYVELIRVLNLVDLDDVERVTGVSKDKIKEVALIYGKAKAAAILWGMGVTQHLTGVVNICQYANLAMMTGNYGKPGSGVNPLRGQVNVQGACDLGGLPDCFPGYKVVNQENTQIFAEGWGISPDKLPSSAGLTSVEAISAIPERIKALYIIGENPAHSHPDLAHAIQNLKNLELMVVQDIFPNKTTELATVILPAACSFEKEGTFTNTERRVQYSVKQLEPPKDAKADWEIVMELAKEMGYEKLFDYTCSEDIFNEIRKTVSTYSGITYDRMKTSEEGGVQWPCNEKYPDGVQYMYEAEFFTDDGKGKFYPCPPMHKKMNVDYPFTLITGRISDQFHTMTMSGRSPKLIKRAPHAFAQINKGDAEILAIEENDPVEIKSPLGSITVKAKVTDDIIKGHVFVPWHYSDALVNKLADSAVDPLGQTPCFKVIPVTLKLSTPKLCIIDQPDQIEDESFSIKVARLFAVDIYESMVKQGYAPIGSGTYFGAKTQRITFKLNKKDKLEIRVEPKNSTLDLEFSTPKNSYTHSLPFSEITEDDVTIINLRKAIGSICAKITNKLINE
ncbi:MAG: formate dehydrogenase subunit alpha [Candidatus Heimdallarchaeota archaeon]|nr:MAG: formate dehydrogenase subunit alpha [Candidatus Heimdallarchaeota archaeon]